ncbi:MULTISPECIES: MarR family winged helix-turn-helix transcriptional regulator [Actinomycetes]|uniref:MarR family transcriptional regulator n=1 Tax=Microbacterium profundi TaxID=450380 RepID=A0ABV3LIV2_9MICO|nr:MULTISPECIES: MarR family transcriptional regulator [Microbacterium]MCE7480833.1 MarR family transcriptional regulator [Microbacterium profundi]
MSDPSGRAVLDGDELETWSSLATLLEWLPTALDAQLLGDSEVTHFEYGILYALADAPEATLRMSVLAGFANSSLSRLSRAAARLEKRGWMRRSPDPADGRFTLAILTDAGLAKVEQAGPGHVKTVRRLVVDPLSPAQLKQLKQISRRILGAIREDEGWRPGVVR